jgi:hypothetical protein
MAKQVLPSIRHLGSGINFFKRMTFSAICKLLIRCYLRTAEFFDYKKSKQFVVATYCS